MSILRLNIKLPLIVVGSAWLAYCMLLEDYLFACLATRPVLIVIFLTICIPTIWGAFLLMKRNYSPHKKISSAMWFAMAAFALCIMSFLNGFTVKNGGMDIHFHDTYIIISHWMIVVAIACFLGFFSLLYYGFPRITGKRLNEKLGKWHFGMTFVVVLILLTPEKYAPLFGTPGRYMDYPEWNSARQFSDWIAAGIVLFFLTAQLLLLINIIITSVARRHGRGLTAHPHP